MKDMKKNIILFIKSIEKLMNSSIVSISSLKLFKICEVSILTS